MVQMAPLYEKSTSANDVNAFWEISRVTGEEKRLVLVTGLEHDGKRVTEEVDTDTQKLMGRGSETTTVVELRWSWK